MEFRTQVIVQLRIEPPDISIFHHAYDASGDLVPEVVEISDPALIQDSIGPNYTTYCSISLAERSAESRVLQRQPGRQIY
ncbi:MAG: hypothetical protein M1829_005252 [Trizodia sp. TS-e1964]|nr:MAG: hypothetical protein M1829_005252 [Trizodia sp. TS-e1964]